MKTLFHPHPSGVMWHYENYHVFFGNQKAEEKSLGALFSPWEFRKVKQVHGKRVVPSTKEILEADAHFTSDSNTALQIITADCLPIFILDPAQQNIMALHAGWRGVVSHIVTEGMTILAQLGGIPKNWRVVIGPHIRRPSFEVDQPVWIQLMDSIPVEFNHETQSFYERVSLEKYKVDLEAIVRAQLKSGKIPMENIDSLEIDTVTDLAWHSYRRDRESAGRNISFICRETK